LNAQDDRGNPIDEQLGNGVHIISANDGLTGHLNYRLSGNNAQFNNHQNVTFQWDKNENLTDRIDVTQANLTEHFYYDALNRIEHSTLAGTTNLTMTYDAAGNILSKAAPSTSSENIGSYSYDATKRHAVKTTSNGWSFSYDANGNMQTDRGATISWYSYNKPNTITNGSVTSSFFYTPGLQYWKQTATYVDGPETTSISAAFSRKSRERLSPTTGAGT
jgi:YD repeat-containing protein